MSALTDKLAALAAQVEAKGKAVEVGVLAEVRALAEKVKALVGGTDDEAVKVSDAVVAEADKVEADATVQVADADAGTAVSDSK